MMIGGYLKPKTALMSPACAVQMMRSIGADTVIDYTRLDFTKTPQPYDVIVNCIGNHSVRAMARMLTGTARFTEDHDRDRPPLQPRTDG